MSSNILEWFLLAQNQMTLIYSRVLFNHPLFELFDFLTFKQGRVLEKRIKRRKGRNIRKIGFLADLPDFFSDTEPGMVPNLLISTNYQGLAIKNQI